MAISSMTGFARVTGSAGDIRWHWEIRAVNGRGLDMRFRLPQGFERLEPQLRENVQKRLSRGSLSITLQLHRGQTASAVRINRSVLDLMLSACEALAASGTVSPPRADGLLALKGVIESDDELENEDARVALDKALVDSFAEGMSGLIEMRAKEGEHLTAILLERIGEIEALARDAEASPARTPEAIGERLSEQVRLLLDAAPALDPQRLHQESVLLATKADVREELDRLGAHVESARALLAGSGPVGRKLEFLAQEFNREANTICSKSNDVALTRIGLELKAVVDQLREQVQNVE
jgi:uncharacterized protein (TIGR00255 family)